jgi:hypothetical protein
MGSRQVSLKYDRNRNHQLISPSKSAFDDRLSETARSNAATDARARALMEKLRNKRNVNEEKNYQKLQQDLKASLDHLDSIDRELSLVDETKRTKIRRQYEDWNLNVHGTIQKSLLKAMNDVTSTEIHNRKLESYNKFLDITNKKAAIFRDIIIESEYDPLEINRCSLHSKVHTLKDPLKIDAQKASAEMSMVSNNKPTSFKVQATKSDRLAPKLWASGKIEATPYGMFASMMSGSEQKVTGESLRKSNVQFDHFNYPRGKAVVDKEMPNPKPRSRKVIV